ncbi:MAG: hypothetical protein Q8903_08635 [Bacteroidota bacterium]|nr:hypothetical protein [Bacteroidota bacterium]
MLEFIATAIIIAVIVLAVIFGAALIVTLMGGGSKVIYCACDCVHSTEDDNCTCGMISINCDGRCEAYCKRYSTTVL